MQVTVNEQILTSYHILTIFLLPCLSLSLYLYKCKYMTMLHLFYFDIYVMLMEFFLYFSCHHHGVLLFSSTLFFFLPSLSLSVCIAHEMHTYHQRTAYQCKPLFFSMLYLSKDKINSFSSHTHIYSNNEKKEKDYRHRRSLSTSIYMYTHTYPPAQ